MKRRSGYLFAVSLLALAGCASTKQFVPEASVREVSAERAVIAVERKPSVPGNVRTVTVEDNGKAVGEVARCGKITWERPAGDMKLTLSKSFGMVSGDAATVEASVQAGTVYKYYVVWSEEKRSFILVGEGESP